MGIVAILQMANVCLVAHDPKRSLQSLTEAVKFKFDSLFCQALTEIFIDKLFFEFEYILAILCGFPAAKLKNIKEHLNQVLKQQENIDLRFVMIANENFKCNFQASVVKKMVATQIQACQIQLMEDIAPNPELATRFLQFLGQKMNLNILNSDSAGESSKIFEFADIGNKSS